MLFVFPAVRELATSRAKRVFIKTGGCRRQSPPVRDSRAAARSLVEIWPAAPKKPDSFENQAFLRLFGSEIWRPIYSDPHADPREGKNAEISPRDWFKVSFSLGALPSTTLSQTLSELFLHLSVFIFLIPFYLLLKSKLYQKPIITPCKKRIIVISYTLL